jgi:glycine/D-amino acid oxidase-like deaminating enzyme
MRNLENLKSDVTIVGGGIAGLWSAKELIDSGLKVSVIEASDTLATGSTTRNEGWLHAGTYHAAAIEQEAPALSVARKIRLGREAILRFAPEAIDHDTTFALLGSDEVTERAIRRWGEADIPYELVNRASFSNHDGVDLDVVREIAKVEDQSINTRLLCAKLAAYVLSTGNDIVTGAHFMPLDDRAAEFSVDGQVYKALSEQFLLAAGNGTEEILRQVTNEEYSIRYFKSHLMIFPRITRDNYFYVDGRETGFMNHGAASIAGLNRDSIEIPAPDYTPVPIKERLLYDALKRLIPAAEQFQLGTSEIESVACVKPDIRRNDSNEPDLDENIFKISDTYTVAFPGKMTQAPHMAMDLVEQLYSAREPRPRELGARALTLSRDDAIASLVSVSPRPMDSWLENGSPEGAA